MSATLLSGIGAVGAVSSALSSGPLGSLLGFAAGPVVLDSVVFTDQEVPQGIKWGGAQKLNVHKMPGGARVIDAMGRDDMAIVIAGRTIGTAAADARGYQLDQMRIAGQPVPLTWGPHLYTVVVSHFECEDKAFMGEFRVTCEVLRDETSDFFYDSPISLLGELTDAANFALNLYSQAVNLTAVGEAIAGSLTGIQGTLEQVGTLTAGDSNAAALAASVAACQAQVGAAMETGEQPAILINQIAAVNGLLFGTTDPTQGISNLVNVQAESGGQAAGAAVQGYLGRMGVNLAAVAGATDAQATFTIPTPPPQTIGGSAGTTLQTAGGNLFAIAAQQLGDATQWYRVALASGLSDPMLSGFVTLTIPDAIQAPSDGIPSPPGVTIL
jgi:hypothetical protein